MLTRKRNSFVLRRHVRESRIRFMPSAALRLWIELETRIASQKLHYRSGSEETAASSIYGLFNTVRQLLGESTPGSPFAEITLAMLNDVIRPFTARWHGWM